jgi:hypothetical protein
VKPNRRTLWLSLLALVAGFACSGTETGNPPTRDACAKIVCTPCAPPIVLRVSDAANGAAIENLAVDGATAPCAADAANPH